MGSASPDLGSVFNPQATDRFAGRRLDIGTMQDWMRANLILGLETQPWRTTVEEVLTQHPVGARISKGIVQQPMEIQAGRIKRSRSRR